MLIFVNLDFHTTHLSQTVAKYKQVHIEQSKMERELKMSCKLLKILNLVNFQSLLQYGETKFLNDCKKNFVDGIIVVDLPWPENKKFANNCKKRSINFVQLISPTTSKKRLNSIIKDSHDMIYYISMLSTTGGKLKVSPFKIMLNYKKIKRINPQKNCVVGFGITEKSIASLKSADGLVVGSAICKEITNSLKKKQNPVTKVGDMVKRLRKKIL